MLFSLGCIDCMLLFHSLYLFKNKSQIGKGLFISHIIFHNTTNKGKARKSSTCFGIYHMSIQNKKVICIQNEKDIHVDVLLALQL